MGGTYEFARHASANLREKDDTLNTVFGGFLAGSVLGLRGISITNCTIESLADTVQLEQHPQSLDTVHWQLLCSGHSNMQEEL